MKKVFISQPMRGRSDEEILKERENVIEKAKQKFNDEVVIRKGGRFEVTGYDMTCVWVIDKFG